jgi:hypothetical protein
VVSHSLDGKISEYHIKHANRDDCLEEVKELKTKGILNPVIPPSKKVNTKTRIEDFFKKQRDLNDFVKKPKVKSSKVKNEVEDIEDSSGGEESPNKGSSDANVASVDTDQLRDAL